MADTIYFNSLSGKKSKFGIKLSGKADKVIEEIKLHTNEKGYINLELFERRTEGKYGETHSLKVDKWERDTSKDFKGKDSADWSGKNDWREKSNDESDDMPF